MPDFDWYGNRYYNFLQKGQQDIRFWTNCQLSGVLQGESYSGGALNGLTVTSDLDTFLRRKGVGVKNVSLIATNTYSYDSAGRLEIVGDNAGNSATYSYEANSPLIRQVEFKQSGTTEMTTTRQYDFLNRLQSIASVAGSHTWSYAYQYNQANQRTRATLADGSFWIYNYDDLGQVISGKRYWHDGTPVAGQQFEYGFDDIGNRNSTKTGGDRNGVNLRPASYTANDLNQYSSRTVPGYLNVLGLATPAATVSVNGTPVPYRRGEYFWSEVGVNNASAVYPFIEVTAVNGGSSATPQSGNIFVPPATETFTHDYDGNLTQDGRWTYTWDAENRLIKMESLGTAPSGSERRLEFEYDARGRRIRKKVTNLGSSAVLSELKMVYDGWNLLAELNVSGGALVRSYVWGLDLSGSLQGAGGVGGLLFVKESSGTHATAYDGNGNVAGLLNMSSGAVSAHYEYGPFGERIRSTGPLAESNPFRFSTKYQDAESGFLYYGYRYYNPSTGRWLNRDPIGERGGRHLYSFLANNGVDGVDFRGLILAGFLADCAKGLVLDGLISGLDEWWNVKMACGEAQDKFTEDPLLDLCKGYGFDSEFPFKEDPSLAETLVDCLIGKILERGAKKVAEQITDQAERELLAKLLGSAGEDGADALKDVAVFANFHVEAKCRSGLPYVTVSFQSGVQIGGLTHQLQDSVIAEGACGRFTWWGGPGLCCCE